MKKYSYQRIINILESTTNATEIEFHFKSDPKTQYGINCFRMRVPPFGILIPGGKKDKNLFKTANEMVEAKLFDGKSLKDLWNEVVITEMH